MLMDRSPAEEDAVSHRPVRIRRRTLLRLAALAPLAQPPVATAVPAAAAPPPHAHRTIIGVI